MGSNQYFKNKALASLEGNWGTAAIATLIIAVISGGISSAVSMPFGNDFAAGMSINSIWSLLCLPLQWGYTVFFLNLIRKDDFNYERLFDGYKDFARTFLMEFLYVVAMLIGFCFFIIPGIIIAIGLMMAPYILKDDQQISAMDALKKSWEVTKGHKMKIFWLGLSFIGWGILCLMTLGIGFFFLTPYMYTTFAHYYEENIKAA
jgi:uncharacterized membrane protein